MSSDTILSIISCRDIAKFQTVMRDLHAKHGNLYLDTFVKTIDPYICIESHEYILNAILKLNTKFKRQYIIQLAKNTQLVHGHIPLLCKMIKRIQINDMIIATILKIYQKHSDVTKKYLIQELLTCISYFTLYDFIHQSETCDTSWLGFLIGNNVDQEELEYYTSRLKDTRLVYKLRSSRIVIDKITNIDSLILHSKLNSALYLVALGLNVKTLHESSLKELLNQSRGRKRAHVKSLVNSLVLTMSDPLCLVNEILSTESGKWITKEYWNRESIQKDKLEKMCTKYIHFDISRHVILRYLFGSCEKITI